jgi:4-hydroxythreonine-4-phosphate dehydrogenase
MKVYITQGHERGIGLEVFFKSLIMLPADDLFLLELIGFQESIVETLKSLKYPFSITNNEIKLFDFTLKFRTPESIEHSKSFSSLKLGMELAEHGGILYTLPTSKDQFPRDAGHTEFFRRFYRAPDLGMFFASPSLQVLLLTDHLPVQSLSQTLTEDLIFNRTLTALRTLLLWNWPVGNVLVSGLNPHAGEHGLIGTEDSRVSSAIKRLRAELKIEMSGPFPGDTMFLEKKSANDLLIYLFHDQGLGVFKGLEGFIGSNITLGLPFPRFSPDHGTSFALFGKNQADYRGCEYSLRQAIKLMRKGLHGKNPSHKSKGS